MQRKVDPQEAGELLSGKVLDSSLSESTFIRGGEEGARLDLNRRVLRWNFPGASGASQETTFLEHNGRNYEVHNNAYLSIIPTNVCNARCGFCVTEIEQVSLENEAVINVKEVPLTVESYAARVDEALNFLKPLPVVPSISISGGGEPTLSARLPAILEVVKTYEPDKLIIHTNGTQLLLKAVGQEYMKVPPRADWTILDHLLDAGLNHLNLSVAHYDQAINSRIMQFTQEKSPESRMSNLEKITDQAIKNGCRPRFSLALLREGICDVGGLKSYLNWARNLGVDDVLVRELAAFNPENTLPSKTTKYTDFQRVLIDSILDGLKSDNDFEFVGLKSGETHYRENYRYKGVIDVGFSVYRLVPQSLESPSTNESDKIKMLVVHPGGSLNASWEDWARVIIPSSPTRLYDLQPMPSSRIKVTTLLP